MEELISRAAAISSAQLVKGGIMRMTEKEKREKVLKALEICASDDGRCANKCPYCGCSSDNYCFGNMAKDALDLLKKSFTPDEVYHTVIEHGQHDKRFRLGDSINYSFSEVVDILRIELMCRAGDM